MSQIINRKIAELKKQNFKTKPQNMVRFKNPYLLKDKTQTLNDILNNNIPLDNTQKQTQPKLIKITEPDGKIAFLNNQNQPVNSDDVDDLELAQHVQSEVYKQPLERRGIQGFKRIRKLGDDETVVYKSDSSFGRNVVLLGVRGSSALNDWIVDAEIGLQKHEPSVRALSGARTLGISLLTEPTPYTMGMGAASYGMGILPYPTTLMNERFDRMEQKYQQIRSRYPNAKIVIGGHSLGNAVGLDILNNHKDDENLKLFGFNGYNHPTYNGAGDKRYATIRAEDDIVSLISDNQANIIKTLKNPEAKKKLLGYISGTGILGGAIYAIRKAKLNKNQAGYQQIINNVKEHSNLNKIEDEFESKFNMKYDDFMKQNEDDYSDFEYDMKNLGGMDENELDLNNPIEWLYNENTNKLNYKLADLYKTGEASKINNAVEEIIEADKNIAGLSSKFLTRFSLGALALSAAFWYYQHQDSNFKPVKPRWKDLNERQKAEIENEKTKKNMKFQKTVNRIGQIAASVGGGAYTVFTLYNFYKNKAKPYLQEQLKERLETRTGNKLLDDDLYRFLQKSDIEIKDIYKDYKNEMGAISEDADTDVLYDKFIEKEKYLPIEEDISDLIESDQIRIRKARADISDLPESDQLRIKTEKAINSIKESFDNGTLSEDIPQILEESTFNTAQMLELIKSLIPEIGEIPAYIAGLVLL